MTIDGIKSGVVSAMTPSNMANNNQPTVTETKEVNVQNESKNVNVSQSTPSSDDNVKNGNNGNSGSEESKEREFQLNEKAIKQRISEINSKLNNNTVAEFGYHDKTNRVTIKIVDKDTKKTIKEIPPEKTLDLIAKAWELAGILVDEKR